jgi:hypothetical protein
MGREGEVFKKFINEGQLLRLDLISQPNKQRGVGVYSADPKD